MRYENIQNIITTITCVREHGIADKAAEMPVDDCGLAVSKIAGNVPATDISFMTTGTAEKSLEVPAATFTDSDCTLFGLTNGATTMDTETDGT
jgi:hypothetical protein